MGVNKFDLIALQEILSQFRIIHMLYGTNNLKENTDRHGKKKIQKKGSLYFMGPL